MTTLTIYAVVAEFEDGSRCELALYEALADAKAHCAVLNGARIEDQPHGNKLVHACRILGIKRTHVLEKRVIGASS